MLIVNINYIKKCLNHLKALLIDQYKTLQIASFHSFQSDFFLALHMVFPKNLLSSLFTQFFLL